MNTPIIEHYDRPPCALHYMSRAFLPSSGLPADADFPDIRLRWSGMRIEPAQLQLFRQITGLSSPTDVSILYPQVFGFRLQMALLTHRAYPLSIWNVLQIRNRLVRYKLFDPLDNFDMETRIGRHRYAAKGIEVDLLSRMTRGDECYWQSRITYLYRGRFGQPPSPDTSLKSPPLTDATLVERWHMPNQGRREFGSLTGDYNGLHLWSWTAQRFGFAAAFLHPQRVAAMCLARLAMPDAAAQTLDLWIKGPVFYGAEVVLNASQVANEVKFGLSLEGDERAALIGLIQMGEKEVERGIGY